MNLTQLKTYAPAARNAFIKAVTRRAGVLGIQPDRVEPVMESGDVALIGGQPFPRSVVPLRKKLVSLIEASGFDHTMESMAYTWFDRLVALRFMELHAGYLDHGYRVLSHPEPTNSLPEIVQHAEHVELKGLDRDEVIRLKLDGNRDEELYRLLLLAQCNQLNHIMPSVFSKLDDVTILLLPDNLLHSDSVIRQLVNGSDPADWERVEVLGWLYQFYISEKKNAVMARKSAVPTDDIPAVTQLFTPHWIVRYLVENSLGRLWLLNRPNSRLREHMPYYIADPANPDGNSTSSNPDGIATSSPGLPGTGYPGSDAPTDSNPNGVASLRKTPRASGRNPVGVDNELKPDPQGSSFLATLGFAPESLQDSKTSGSQPGDSPTFLKISNPEDIRLCDPACGSGHMLTYAFDLLVKIYEEEGYADNDIPSLILKHNLFGLEICPRAAQLAELALVLKAREKSRRFFSEAKAVRPNIIELQNVRFNEGELSGYFKALGSQPSTLHPQLNNLFQQFEESKTFGSLIQPCLSEAEIQAVRLQIQNLRSHIQDLASLMVGATHIKVLCVLEQAESLTQRYHVVIANPPYMGGSGMNTLLKKFLQDTYADYRSDLFAVFIIRSLNLAFANGHLGFMSPFVWMFISSYEKLRHKLINDTTITTLVQLEYSGFDGATVPICTFTLKTGVEPNYLGGFVRLSDFRGSETQGPKTLEAIDNPHCGWFYRCCATSFRRIPGTPIAYWLSREMLRIFDEGKPLGEFAEARRGVETGDNERFLRSWHEVDREKVGIGCTGNTTEHTWFPYNKGGGFKKWYGNRSIVINWRADGHDMKNQLYPAGSRLPWRAANEEWYFRTGITWGGITSGTVTFRLSDYGAVFDSKGAMIFPDALLRPIILALLNTSLVGKLLKVLNPSLNTQKDDVNNIPVVNFEKIPVEQITKISAECVEISQADECDFETSWDFRDQPLLRPGLKGTTLQESWRNWEAQSTAAIRRMQELETENNRLFITAYGLDGELQPEVPEAQITLAHADARRDMAAFLSYAIGCMMGRYSLDAEGLVLANAGDTVESMKDEGGSMNGWKAAHAGESEPFFILHHSSFIPDSDGIIPVLDGEWFEDDLVARTKEFLRTTFGEATLNENLRFIEQSLGRELRDYFLTDFYKDHLQTYKNRPVYWLFSSGKQKAFQCLVYLHRYTPGTLARMRTEYVIPLQGKLAARITRLEEEVTQTSSSATRKKLQTDLDKSKKQMVELLAYDEQLRSYTNHPITLDLDDGVKTNYAKFGTLVAESKKVCGTKDD